MSSTLAAPRELAGHYKATRERLWGKPPKRLSREKIIPVPSVRDNNAAELLRLQAENQKFRSFLYSHSFNPVDVLNGTHLPDNIIPVENPLEPPTVKLPTITLIAKIVCEHFDILHVDMVSARRNKAVRIPRQIAMYLSRTMTSRSYPFIGARFGGRDHTTCLNAIWRIEELLQKDPAFGVEIDAIREKVVGALA